MKHGLQLLSILIAALFALLLPISYAEQVSAAPDSLKASEAISWKPQTHCPVMGGKINKKLFSDYADQRIYYCCGGCRAEFEKEPVKYLEKLESLGESTERIPVKRGHGTTEGKIHDHGQDKSQGHPCKGM